MMINTDDAGYYAARERASLKLAEAANDSGIRSIHLYMANSYRQRALQSAQKIQIEQAPAA